MIKLATWNINSLKVRLEQVLSWLDTSGVDILSLQETKLINENFPLQAFKDKQWYVVYSGQKTYNGVAIISRYPIDDVMTDIPGFEDPQRRILIGTTAGIRIINLYVPNGAVVDSEKYVYKLNWLEKVTAFIRLEMERHPRLAVVGDFNIAPQDDDVHDPMAWQGQVLVSPREREAFSQLLGLRLCDSVRHLNPDNKKLYSWWDYRTLGFRRNHGLRIDHILLSDALVPCCTESLIDIEPRRADRPSDHAPVIVTLKSSDHNCNAAELAGASCSS